MRGRSAGGRQPRRHERTSSMIRWICRWRSATIATSSSCKIRCQKSIRSRSLLGSSVKLKSKTLRTKAGLTIWRRAIGAPTVAGVLARHSARQDRQEKHLEDPDRHRRGDTRFVGHNASGRRLRFPRLRSRLSRLSGRPIRPRRAWPRLRQGCHASERERGGNSADAKWPRHRRRASRGNRWGTARCSTATIAVWHTTGIEAKAGTRNH